LGNSLLARAPVLPRHSSCHARGVFDRSSQVGTFGLWGQHPPPPLLWGGRSPLPPFRSRFGVRLFVTGFKAVHPPLELHPRFVPPAVFLCCTPQWAGKVPLPHQSLESSLHPRLSSSGLGLLSGWFPGWAFLWAEASVPKLVQIGGLGA